MVLIQARARALAPQRELRSHRAAQANAARAACSTGHVLLLPVVDAEFVFFVELGFTACRAQYQLRLLKSSTSDSLQKLASGYGLICVIITIFSQHVRKDLVCVHAASCGLQQSAAPVRCVQSPRPAGWLCSC